MSDLSNFIITRCSLETIWFLLPRPTMFKSQTASSSPLKTTGWQWAGSSGKAAARTICFRFLAEPRCAVKCIPFTRPASPLLKLLVLQVRWSFPNSGGAIILMEQDSNTHTHTVTKHTHTPPVRHLLLKLWERLLINLITACTGLIKHILLKQWSPRRQQYVHWPHWISLNDPVSLGWFFIGMLRYIC